MDSVYFLQMKLFPNLNVVAHLVVPAGCSSSPPRLAIFASYFVIPDRFLTNNKLLKALGFASLKI